MPDDDPRRADSPTLIRDPEEAVAAFNAVGVEARFDRIGRRSAFSIDFQDVPIGGSKLVSTRWGTDSELTVDLADHVAVVVNPLDSAPSVFTTSGEGVPASTAEAPILQPGRRITILRPAETPLLVLSAELEDLKRHFREIAGVDPGPLRFASSVDRNSPEGRRLQRVVDYAVGELNEEPSSIDNPIIRRQLDDLVLGMLLSLPGDHHRLLEHSNGYVGSMIVCRAEEFMAANVGRPIGMSDVAAECGCSRTKLFQAFRQEREWTPLQFLVRRRMELAHRRLFAPGNGVTVTMVSLDCGYANLSQFAHEYRKLYGETPSMTLRRSR